MRVAYIRDKAALSQSTISNYLGILKDAGLVLSERHGQWTFYRRNKEAIMKLTDAFAKEILK